MLSHDANHCFANNMTLHSSCMRALLNGYRNNIKRYHKKPWCPASAYVIAVIAILWQMGRGLRARIHSDFIRECP